MSRERLYLYDTTLRDGQQTQGVAFSLEDKQRITQELDKLGLDYIEGGWPGANPVDEAFFGKHPQLENAKLTAFGMTKRSGRSVSNDSLLSGVLDAQTEAVCLVGKAHDFHVEHALGISLEENLNSIRQSFQHIVDLKREALFDAEHFFDGFKANPDYALKTIHAAYEAGATWVVLCDTNGGSLPDEIKTIVHSVIQSGIPGNAIGIHCHDDTGQAIACSLAAIEAGARQIQGTLNGLGERCGNANLITLIPNLLLKPQYSNQFELGISKEALTGLTRLSRLLDEILNRVPLRQAPYVGASAFVHKAGLHASAVQKNPATYEHVPPESVGNQRLIPISNQAGLSNLRMRLLDAGIKVDKNDPRLPQLLEEIKRREAEGYSYDSAQASFELLARNMLGETESYFEVERYRVSVERRRDHLGNKFTLSEAVVVVLLDGEKKLSVSESQDEAGSDHGPVNALARALRKDLGKYQTIIDKMHLADFKVRITQGGTEAITRVIIDSEDIESGEYWSTVGVSANIVDASFEALLESINWKLSRELSSGFTSE